MSSYGYCGVIGNPMLAENGKWLTYESTSLYLKPCMVWNEEYRTLNEALAFAASKCCYGVCVETTGSSTPASCLGSTLSSSPLPLPTEYRFYSDSASTLCDNRRQRSGSTFYLFTGQHDDPWVVVDKEEVEELEEEFAMQDHLAGCEEEWYQEFVQLDEDKDGYLSASDLKGFVIQHPELLLGATVLEDAAVKLLAPKGKVDWPAFLEICKELLNTHWRRRFFLTSLFNTYSKNRGYLKESDVSTMISQYCEGTKTGYCKEVLKRRILSNCKNKNRIKLEEVEKALQEEENGPALPPLPPGGLGKAVVYENERWFPVTGWSKKLLPTDRSPWSDRDGRYKLSKDMPLPPDCRWEGSWTIESGDLDDDWEYARGFQFPFSSEPTPWDCVRRRKWRRDYLSTKPLPSPEALPASPLSECRTSSFSEWRC
eukprot:Sspe_Gene.13323::Locus_4567_Transcript_1_1_Confidence_1.000_Length_1501::g.13323::m.13323